jgi:hypothetical protein
LAQTAITNTAVLLLVLLHSLSYIYSKIVQSDQSMLKIQCSDWLLFEYKNKVMPKSFMAIASCQISENFSLDNTNDDSLTTPLMINEIDEITIISGYIVNI